MFVNIVGSIRLPDENRKCIRFTISGILVCKDFFRRATGFSKNLFNGIYNSVEKDKPLIIKSKAQTFKNFISRVEDTIAFLDGYFKAETPGINFKKLFLFC